MKDRIVVGSRGSKLALLQAQEVVDQLSLANPHLNFELKTIKTVGDIDRKTSLQVLGGKGIFVKEIEDALLRHDIDIAVHSLKDMPTEIEPSLRLAAVTQRLDPRDVFVSARGVRLSKLPPGSRIGTGSQRRAVQLLTQRPDVAIADMRGNIDTRLRKCVANEVDGIMLAAAALIRMKMDDKITQYLPADTFVPAVGQGTLGIEIRDDSEMDGIVAALNHRPTWLAVTAERAFLKALGGGCREPIAALGVVKGTKLYLRGMVANCAANDVMYADVSGEATTAEKVGVRLALEMLKQGAGVLIGRCEA
jgi:hydroxymethylbilane synthase